jgi:hypothetical protein
VLDPEKLPITQTVNWIAYSSYTPGQGPNRSDFTPKWTDEFNNLDNQRWARANWTFDGNMADFTPNNAVVSGGYLMLFLSKKGGSGTPTPPSDPQGNTRPPVAIASPRLQPAPFSIGRLPGGLRVEAGDRASEISILNLDGRILARGKGPGTLRFEGLAPGALVVRAPQGSVLVPSP